MQYPRASEQIEGQPPAEERFITARFAAMVQRSFVRRPRKEAERFLSAQGDAFAGAKAEETIALLRTK
jgi:hypothetical protein